MSEFADLHMHSLHSDGTRPPEELIPLAQKAGLRAISLTDHDTITGWPVYRAACEDAGIEAIPGVELSSGLGERDAHILGYLVDPESDQLETALVEFRRSRVERARTIVDRLNEVGVPLSFADVERTAGVGVIGRPHIAEALAEAGFVPRYDDAFRRYIGLGCPAYVPKARFEAAQAVQLIHDVGGLAVLAHPGAHYRAKDLRYLSSVGLDGVEIIHPRHTSADTRRFTALADEMGLLMTGGSDYHGGSRGDARVGRPRIPYDLVTKLRERR